MSGHDGGGMLRRSIRLIALAVVVGLALLPALPGGARAASPGAGGQPLVRAVLFYSPTCPHCHQVMTYDLPPLLTYYGDRLQVAAVDATTTSGSRLFDAAIAAYGISEEWVGVPALFAGSTPLIGAVDIPGRLPSVVNGLLAQGGSDWPPIPGLAEYFAGLDSIPLLTVQGSAGDESPIAAALDRAAEDPAGSALSVIVLAALLVCLAWAARAALPALASGRYAIRPPSNLIPLIAVAGLGVAAYLAMVEMSGSSAVCGPVGDCNRVHESDYARLFGLLPVGLLGCAGYLGILAAWVVGRLPLEPLTRLARWGLLAMAVFGAAFSIYLTFLEPFVIGATCGWCLASAVLMGFVLVLATLAVPPRPKARDAGRPMSRRSRRRARAAGTPARP